MLTVVVNSSPERALAAADSFLALLTKCEVPGCSAGLGGKWVSRGSVVKLNSIGSVSVSSSSDLTAIFTDGAMPICKVPGSIFRLDSTGLSLSTSSPMSLNDELELEVSE